MNPESSNLFSGICATLEGGGGGGAIRLSTTHGHITNCKLDSVVYAGVCVVILNVDLSCLGQTIYARQFLGAQPLILQLLGLWPVAKFHAQIW